MIFQSDDLDAEVTAPIQAVAHRLPHVISHIQKALDEGPMEGPWVAVGPSFGEPLPKFLNEVVIEDGSDSPDIVCGCEPAGDPESSATMEFIAVCNPDNIRTLLAAIAAHEAEVGRLTQELNVASVGEFGAQSANRHLSALVDFERQVSERCMAVMKDLMDAAEPVNNEFQDCHIDYADYAKFVDAHAELLYVIKNGERPAALTQGETK